MHALPALDAIQVNVNCHFVISSTHRSSGSSIQIHHELQSKSSATVELSNNDSNAGRGKLHGIMPEHTMQIEHPKFYLRYGNDCFLARSFLRSFRSLCKKSHINCAQQIPVD